MKAAFAGWVQAVGGGAEVGPVFAQVALPPEWAGAHPEETARLVAQANAATPETLAADFQSVVTMPDLRPRLAEIRVPTLVRVGEAEQNAPRPWSEAIARAIPGARLEVVPGVSATCTCSRTPRAPRRAWSGS